MKVLNKIILNTQYGDKSLEVVECDILDFTESIDILTVSAFYRSYQAIPRTMIGAIYTKGICVHNLSLEPELDLRDIGNIWLSKNINGSELPIKRIGCVEMSSTYFTNEESYKMEKKMLSSIHAYFDMLDIASNFGISVETIALPILGAGCQGVSQDLTMIPIINEGVEFLKRNPFVKKIYIIERNQFKALQAAKTIEKYAFVCKNELKNTTAQITKTEKLAFISYSSLDKNIADIVCRELEGNGIKVWYAPRDIAYGNYAEAIVTAIMKCNYFIVIISKNSLKSHHVLNEIDIAFKELDRDVKFLPFRIDEEDMIPAFTYYLSRQHWIEGYNPPIELRVKEFVNKIVNNY